MSERRSTRRKARRTRTTRTFTLDQLRKDPLRVIGAAKKEGGCFVVDDERKQRFSVWIPQTPIRAD